MSVQQFLKIPFIEFKPLKAIFLDFKRLEGTYSKYYNKKPFKLYIKSSLQQKKSWHSSVGQSIGLMSRRSAVRARMSAILDFLKKKGPVSSVGRAHGF